MTETLNDNYSLISHSMGPQILLLAKGSGWTLPQHQYNEAPDIDRAMKEQLGLDVTVLSCIYDRYHDEDREDTHRIYALENHSPDWTPPAGSRWVGRQTLNDLPLLVPEHRSIIDTWLSEIESGNIPPLRVPWARLGWFDTAASWIRDQLTSQGYSITGPIEQAHVRVWSTLLRVQTNAGPIYFKATAPSFGFEPALTRAMAELWPAHIPRVLTIDNERHWMLMEDAGTPFKNLDNLHELSSWEELLALFARMQIESVAHLDTLQALGSPDRRLNVLPSLFERLLADKSTMLIGQRYGLTEAEFEQLLASSPQFRQMCAELASYNIPETLHHDDFHPSNMMVKNNSYIFLDWADGMLAHPFYSMIIVLRYAKLLLNFEDAELIRMRDAYLKEWTLYEPLDRLIEAFTLAQGIGLICRSWTWYYTISHYEAKDKWEDESSVPLGLRRFLRNKPYSYGNEQEG